jgi:hypothetical protein
VELDDDRTTIMQVLRAYHAAMVDARTEDLSTLLDDDFSLVHITGYRQPETEWFGAIRSGRFDFPWRLANRRGAIRDVLSSSCPRTFHAPGQHTCA